MSSNEITRFDMYICKRAAKRKGFVFFKDLEKEN